VRRAQARGVQATGSRNAAGRRKAEARAEIEGEPEGKRRRQAGAGRKASRFPEASDRRQGDGSDEVASPRHALTPASGAPLKTFISAVTAGDREVALACLDAAALSDLGPDPSALPLAEVQATVRSFTGYVAEGDLGPFWAIRALRQGERPKWIFFERTGAGEWKIVGI